MNILVIEHEKADLMKIVSSLREFEPDAKVEGKESFDEALNLVNTTFFDLAFLDADSKDEVNAAEFAQKLKAGNKDVHIIFTSKSKKYMSEAFSVHADAYLIKPITMEDIKREMDYLMNNYPAPLRPIELIVRTFGGFNVYYRGKRLLFKRSKAKELLAILIDNRGMGLKTQEACSMLFNGRKYNEITLGYFHVVLTSLKFTLEGYGIKNLLKKSVNYIAINPDMVDCDMYRYLKGDPEAIKDYHGDYMSGYSWSEYTSASLNEKKEELNAG